MTDDDYRKPEREPIPEELLPVWAFYGTYQPFYGTQLRVRKGKKLSTDALAGLCESGHVVKFMWWRDRLEVAIFKPGITPQPRLSTDTNDDTQEDDSDD